MFLTACTGMTPETYVNHHGTPDLISERAGDELRLYLPGKRVEPWPRSARTFYYVNKGVKVTFEGGAAHEAALTDADRNRVEQTLKEIRN
jgi:hypothetical protein